MLRDGGQWELRQERINGDICKAEDQSLVMKYLSCVLLLVCPVFLSGCILFPGLKEPDLTIVVRNKDGEPVEGAVLQVGNLGMFAKHYTEFLMTDADGVAVSAFTKVAHVVVYKEAYDVCFHFMDSHEGEHVMEIVLEDIADKEHPERNSIDLERALVEARKYEGQPGFEACKEPLLKILKWFEDNGYYTPLEGEELKACLEKYM